MKSILIVGSGAREHALAWKLRQSPEVGSLYVAPGNAGTALVAENVPLAATDLPAIVRFVKERDIALTVVGPEAPLALGLADALRLHDRRVVGPGAAAARIESSKSFAKNLMARAGVPTARYAVFDQPQAALRNLARAGYPLVVKADGLAAGKGVSICTGEREAREAVTAMMVDGAHGTAGRRVVVEEALSGPEISLLALVDGEHVVPLPLAQDHKRLGDGDTGPNTGGMGAYAPVPLVGPTAEELSKLVLEPVVGVLAELGTPYQGVLYAGLMLTEAGPRVLEYNCRFGDPETQVILPLLADDLLPWLEAVAAGADGSSGLPLHRNIPVLDRSAVGVVLAAPGYPESPRAGARIEGLNEVLAEKSETGSAGKSESSDAGVLVFHAGTARDAEEQVVTAGGRVLTVVGIGPSIDEAARQAYAAPVRFEGMQRRTDIAWQATPQPGPTLTPGPSPTRGRGEAGSYCIIDNSPSPASSCSPVPGYRVPSGCGLPGLGGEGARIAVLASGDGSNLQALLDACERGEADPALRVQGGVDANVVLVVSSNLEARALARARRAGVPAVALPLKNLRDPIARRRYEEQLLDVLRPSELDLIVLAGWMLILSEDFLNRCPCPLINVHPALLQSPPSPASPCSPVPGYPLGLPGLGGEGESGVKVLRGAHAVRDALALGMPYTGVSIHYVTPEVDAGPVILSEVVPIEPGDDEDSLYRRIKAVEHRLLPQAVHSILAAARSRTTPVTIGGVYA